MHADPSTVMSWRIDEQRAAHFELGSFRAVVQVDRPQDGVSASLSEAPTVGGGYLLQLVTRGAFPQAADSVYERGLDLVATYEATDAHPIRTQVYWRAVEAGATAGMHGGIDLIVSAQTDLLDADPGMCVRSSLVGQDVLTLAGPAQDRWEAVTPQGSAESLEVSRPPGCFLVRLPEGDCDYLEMIHPADFRGGEVTVSESGRLGAKAIQFDHRLFDGRLEKGVILRSRVRGVFLARGADSSLATRCYRQFAESEPPLTV